ncbi:uncharacterized protein N7446_000357 [Penicillium canescens]|uniref:uncharacterized protein n=1 Tax=Penicillium canescens TaxID=5083 RepID=UPI0026DFC872|nr:uncharacterized protein N7446_000357 [Penicillium canescens]KAJ6059706.1 hypothetical protein N7444_003345 [Penicillium canescens]KAJ6077421.1 hypothetical protein N7446_000357 [Penicillium canescens]
MHSPNQAPSPSPQWSEGPQNAVLNAPASAQGGSRNIGNGRPSTIHDYCLKANREGRTKCIWICMKKGRRWIAKDISVEKTGYVLGIPELRKQCSWWKRHSLFSVVGVKEIMNRRHTECHRALGLSQRRVGMRSGYHGEKPPPGIECSNSAWDEIEGTYYCSVQHFRELNLQEEVYKWLPAMIECYWQNGIQSDDLEFLEAGKFVTLYRVLAWDTQSDAASPYGRVIYGFKLVEGWRTRYLLYLVMASLFLSACVVAIATAVLQDFEAGLTAGSYALAITAVALAVLTFLSAVI